MGKKIFSPTLYPKDRDISKEWFVQYWTQTYPQKRCKVRVPNLPDWERRLKYIHNLISDSKKNLPMPN